MLRGWWPVKRIARPNANFLYQIASSSSFSRGMPKCGIIFFISWAGSLPGSFPGIGTEHGETNLAERG
jgi:hypothetical protein